MRTAIEIAEDITEAREWLRGYGFINVHGKSPAELAELEAKRMDIERRLAGLERERAQYVNAPSAPKPQSGE